MKISRQPSLSKSKNVHAKADVLAIDAEAGPEAGDLERAAVVAVQRGDLFGEVRPDDIEPAIAVVVADARAHARQRHAVLVEGAARRSGDLPERAVVIVPIEEARRGVARDVDVGPPVVVEVGGHGAHAVGSRRAPVAAREDHRRGTARTCDAGRLRDVLERPVAAVAIEHVRAAGKPQRPARHGDLVVATVGGVAGPGRLLHVEGDVVGDEEIDVAVAVEIQETTAGAPSAGRPGEAGALGHVGERAVAVVMVEHVAAVVADEQIVESVVVVIANRAGLAPA